MKRINLIFFCNCPFDCDRCPKPEESRGFCIVVRDDNCLRAESPKVCPCLSAKFGD